MRELATLGLSDDGRFLVAKDATTGEHFRLSIDRRLASLIDRAPSGSLRSGQMEIPMESSLTPRDIQIRIRRGESVEEVAEAAGISFDQAHGFAIPVLAERSYMVEQARKTTVRRKHVGGTPVALSELTDDAIGARGVTPDDSLWDSWRREDGRWAVQVTVDESVATFVFDPKSRYVIADDEAAHDLVGDLATVEQDEMALADVLAATAVKEAPEDHPGAVHSLKEARDRRAQEQEQEQEHVPDESKSPNTSVTDREDTELQESVAVPDSPTPRKKPSRRSVPTWDEIMFGDSRD